LNLNKGIWNTDTLLKDTAYFRAMTNTSQNLNLAYGYLWWLNGKASGMAPGFQIVFPGPLMSNAPSDMYAALGKNDQKIYVVPSTNMVVVRQGNTAGGFSLAASAFDNVLWDYINKLDCSVTSITEETNNHYKLYPNPINDILTIENPNLLIDEVKVVDILGNIVYETTLMPQTSTLHIDFVGFSKGIYFVEIKNAQQIQVRYKLVKL
jgi:hypothetical protein